MGLADCPGQGTVHARDGRKRAAADGQLTRAEGLGAGSVNANGGDRRSREAALDDLDYLTGLLTLAHADLYRFECESSAAEGRLQEGDERIDLVAAQFQIRHAGTLTAIASRDAATQDGPQVS